AQLLRLGHEDHVLLLTLHHIIFDRWSRAILSRELTAFYEAFRDGKPSPLGDLKLQYGDYVAWQRRHLQGKRYEKQLAFWKSHLADAPSTLDLPTDRPRPAIQTTNGAFLNFNLPEELADRVREFSKQCGATPYMTLLAVFNVLLARYS